MADIILATHPNSQLRSNYFAAAEAHSLQVGYKIARMSAPSESCPCDRACERQLRPNTRAVEDVRTAHPAVRQAVIIGVSDPKWGEAVKDTVVLAHGEIVSLDELIALVHEREEPAQAPKSVEFIESIPLSTLGKPDKKVLRAIYKA